MIKIIITLLTFIPWILFSISTTHRSIKQLRKKDEKIKLIHKEDVVLGIVFLLFSLIFFKSSQIKLVKILLFITFNLYLFLYSIYDKNKEELEKKEHKILIVYTLLLLMPIIFYLITRFYTITYYIMFLYNIFNGYLVLLSIKITKKKRKNEKHL